ncbi:MULTISPECIES: hypothetical protein [unclassified Leptolyngbya]|uniref:hypothetical protein n=1 Tax=unclassified Leptolyngbya TaxID=2650499 RepID=UPI00168486E1|nr:MULTISPECIES: hypothetical protein [unclassified Leptolyngbya]MBD1910907.1 hypothetical protein [Leptolyngbya sp. FACHB-8]MBD2154952.1 hypothetical protein [Leptolyngbya sp. FACHB-16]
MKARALVLLAIVGVLSTSSVVAAQQARLPQPNANGDYTARTSHSSWQVVDPDPNGLNCRWSSQMPAEWYAPDARLPRRDVVNWGVVRRFATGTVLTANTTPAGFATMTDSRGLPWLKVSIGNNDQICLVRANSRFVRPR